MTKEKAIELAVDALKKARHPYAVRSSGSSMLFEFGIMLKAFMTNIPRPSRSSRKLGKIRPMSEQQTPYFARAEIAGKKSTRSITP